MEIDEKTGISYNPEFITLRLLHHLAEDDTVDQIELPNTLYREQSSELEKEVFDDIWNVMSEDPEFSSVIARHEVKKYQYLDLFRKEKEIDEEVVKHVAEIMKIDYSVEECDDESFLHVMDGDTIVQIPKSTLNAAKISDQLQYYFGVCKCVLDAVMMIAAAVGVGLAVMERRVARTAWVMVDEYRNVLARSTNIFERIEKMQKKVDKIITVFRLFHGQFSVYSTINDLFAGMSLCDRAIAIAEVIFQIGLIALSGMTSVLARALTLLIIVAMFVSDLVVTLKALHRWKG